MKAIRNFLGIKNKQTNPTNPTKSNSIKEDAAAVVTSGRTKSSSSFTSMHRSISSAMFREANLTKDSDMMLSHVVQLEDYDLPLRKTSTSKRMRGEDFSSVEILSVGTNSILFKALLGSREVVIKMINADAQYDRNAIAEFEMEASILEHSNHPHVIKYLGAGVAPRRFIVLEYLDEGTLAEELRRTANEPSTLLAVLVKGIQLADALEYLHSKCIPGVSIVHRDLKPDNIGFSNGTMKVFDFGLAIAIKERSSSEEAFDMTGGTGTMRYMAPEVALNRFYSEKVDVYSFGIILWQIASNQIPFETASHASFLKDVVKGGERPPLDPSWPESFRILLSQCWDVHQTSRPSFTQIKASLEMLVIGVMTES